MTTIQQQKIKIKQVRSGLGRSKKQLSTLKGLGLKIHKTVEVIDTSENRGMIKKVQHLIEVIC